MSDTKQMKAEDFTAPHRCGVKPYPGDFPPNPCKGIMGLLFGHDYEHMYNEEIGAGVAPGEEILLHRACGERLADIIQASRSYKDKYVCSICSRCGDVIKLSDAP